MLTFKKWQESRIAIIDGNALPTSDEEKARLSSDEFKGTEDSFVDVYGVEPLDGFIYERMGVIAILPKEHRDEPSKKYWIILFNEEPTFYTLEEAELWLWNNFVKDDVLETDKDVILDYIEELQHDWIHEGIAKVQEEFGMKSGDCSTKVDMDFRYAFSNLAKATYNQLKENGYLNNPK